MRNGQPMLEVVALHPTDAEHAQEGGADRLHVCVLVDGQPRTPEPAKVSAILRATDLPVRVTLRLSAGSGTQGGELTRLAGLAADLLGLGAEGVVLGFLTSDLDIDVEVCAVLVDVLGDAPWTFDRVFDQALDARRAWRQLSGLPGLDAVHSAGAALGFAAGAEDLLALAHANASFAAAALATGGVVAEQVPWLVRAGIQGVHLGAEVRPGGSWAKAHVDAGFVRSWRLLLDDAAARR